VALDLLVRAHAEGGDADAAKTALAELNAIDAVVGTIHAAASLAAGYVALGTRDADAARRHLEDAVDLFLQSGAPFELARARIALGRALQMLGRVDGAGQEAQRAIALLTELRAELELSRARTLLASIETMTPADPPVATGAGGLSARELEVLRLVAEGLNNQIIAERLFLSE